MRSRKVEDPKKWVASWWKWHKLKKLIICWPPTRNKRPCQEPQWCLWSYVSSRRYHFHVRAEENLESLEPLEKAPLVDVPEKISKVWPARCGLSWGQCGRFAELRSSITLPAGPLSIAGSSRKISSGEQGDLGFGRHWSKVRPTSLMWKWWKNAWNCRFVHRRNFLDCQDPSQDWTLVWSQSRSGPYFLWSKNGVMSVNAIIEEYRTNPRKASIQVPLFAFYRKESGEHYLGLADPEKRKSVVADLVCNLASVSKVVGVFTASVLFVCEEASARSSL